MVTPVSPTNLPNRHFAAADYAVFGIMLVVSVAIGFVFACTGGRQKTTTEFLLAGRSMHFIPISLSMIATFMSAITLLGTPAEIYVYGTQYWMIGVSYLFVMPLSAFVFFPIFYKLRVTSVFEYIEMRFDAITRCLAVAVFIFQMLMYLSIVLYAPSLALSAVTGFNVWAAVWSVGLICTIYTTIGGMKAVMWTDTFQMVVMFVAMMTILGVGSSKVGGFSKAWNVARRMARIEFFNFNPDMTWRHTVWGLVIGGTFSWTAIYGVNQAQVQRALSAPTLRMAQIAYLLNIPGLFVLLLLVSMIGVVLFARYATCDPLSSGAIHAEDQLLPYFVMDILGTTPGMPGLFVAGLFSGALSTLSSGLNCLSAVVLQDFIRRFYKPGLGEEKATCYSKIMVFLFGILVIALTYIASLLGGILEAALALFGILGGPLLGIFTLGILLPWANSKGAIAGFVTSLFLNLWMGIASKIAKPPLAKPPVFTFGCRGNNGTSKPVLSVIRPPRPQLNGLEKLYSVSYIWYSFIAVLVVCVIGLVVSFATGSNVPSETKPRLICPICDVICPCLPSKLRKWMYCGVRYHGKRPESANASVVSFNPTIEYSTTPTPSIATISLPSTFSHTSGISYETSV